MKQLLQTILQPIVRHPESLTITETTEDRKVVYTVNAHEEDIGRIIGKGGRAIKAARTIMTAANDDPSVRVFVDVE